MSGPSGTRSYVWNQALQQADPPPKIVQQMAINQRKLNDLQPRISGINENLRRGPTNLTPHGHGHTVSEIQKNVARIYEENVARLNAFNRDLPPLLSQLKDPEVAEAFNDPGSAGVTRQLREVRMIANQAQGRLRDYYQRVKIWHDDMCQRISDMREHNGGGARGRSDHGPFTHGSLQQQRPPSGGSRRKF